MINGIHVSSKFLHWEPLMHKNTFFVLVATSLFLLFTSVAYAADCPPTAPWSKIPNYKQSMGTPCRALGLDTHNGVCQPGQAYETLCDDTKGGRYKTCQGRNRCGGNQVAPAQNCKNWDYNYNRPCPQGFVNFDCQGGCEPQ